MLKALAFGIAVGVGVQAWRRFPADGPVTDRTAALVLILGVLAAFLAGLWHGRGHRGASASAYASARAEATAVAAGGSASGNTVNLAVVVPGGGAAPAGGVMVPGEGVSWLGAARQPVSLDDLDGADLGEIAGVLEHDFDDG